MRVFFIPENPLVWIFVAALIGGVALFVWVRQRFFPSVTQKALADPRYRQALTVYVEHLPGEDPTRDERWDAFGAAILYLKDEHGIPPEEAGPNLRAVVKQYDREQ